MLAARVDSVRLQRMTPLNNAEGCASSTLYTMLLDG